jgi:hypothetical protein
MNHGGRFPEVAVNRVQRRLFRVFFEASGQQPPEADTFARQVEAMLATLTPKVRSAVEIAWRAPDTPDYATLARELAARDGEEVSLVALRQRVSRGLRAVEQALRSQQHRRGLADA